MAFVHAGQREEAVRVLEMSAETAGFADRACRFVRLALTGRPEDAEACFDPDLLARAGRAGRSVRPLPDARPRAAGYGAS
jgi:hypothetical protein